MSERLAKVPQLDALRALAAFAIIAYHFIPEFTPRRLPFGWIGVDLFFVISGFLITHILLGQKAAIKDRWRILRYFIIKRSLRLFPAYFAMIGVFAVLMRLTGLWSWDPGEGIWYWTYTSNYLQFLHGARAGHLTHLWSLAVEEQFYLLWPWLVLFLSTPWLRRALVLLVVIGFAFKSFSGWENARLLTFSHFDTLGCGALIALHRSSASLFRMLGRHTLGWVLAGSALLLLHELWRHIAVIESVGILLIVVPLTVRCIAGFSGRFGRLMDHPRSAHFGRISYGLYLYHKPIPLLLKLVLAHTAFHFPGWVLLPMALLLTWIVAELSFRYLERPFLRLKERFDL